MWPTLLPIIARYGIEFAYKLWALIKDQKDPVEEDWAALRNLAKPYDEYIADANARLNPPSPPT